MSKICQNCGKPMADDMRFCESCGAPYQAPVQQPVYQQPTYQQPAYQQPAAPAAAPAPAPAAAPAKKSFDINKTVDDVKKTANGLVNRAKKDKKFLGICIGAVAAAIVLIVVLCVFVFRPFYASAMDNLIAVKYKGKANKIEKLAPAEYWEWVDDKEDGYGIDIDDVKEYYEDEYWDYMSDVLDEEFGNNIRVTYKKDGKVKNLTDKKVEKIADSLKDQYDIDKDKVKAAKVVEFEVTVKGSEDDDDADTEMTFVKIGSKWYPITIYEEEDDDGKIVYDVSFEVEYIVRSAYYNKNSD